MTADVIGTQTRWGVVIATGFIAANRYVWVEQHIRLPGRSFAERFVVSMLPWALVFPVAVDNAAPQVDEDAPSGSQSDTSDGAPDVAQIQDAGTLEATG